MCTHANISSSLSLPFWSMDIYDRKKLCSSLLGIASYLSLLLSGTSPSPRADGMVVRWLFSALLHDNRCRESSECVMKAAFMLRLYMCVRCRCEHSRPWYRHIACHVGVCSCCCTGRCLSFSRLCLRTDTKKPLHSSVSILLSHVDLSVRGKFDSCGIR